jgi:copper chaperone NosL
MTIMDKRFGGEVITTKGKIYKFDSAECLVEYFKQDAEEKKSVRSLFVIDHSVPGQFIDATKAYYLHSEKLPSPMGANLSSVQDKATIDNYFLEYGGEVWTWDDVLVNIH